VRTPEVDPAPRAPGPRRRPAVRILLAAAVAAAAAGWVAAAVVLWRTSTVPSNLHLPHVDLHHYFSARELSRAASFERFERVDFLLAQIALVAVFAVYAARGARLIRESAAGPIGTGMLLGMLGFGLVWLVQVPFGLAELWWQRRHGVSREGYLDWLFSGWGGLGGEFLFICFALLIVMALARLLGEGWWLAAAPTFVGLAILFAFLTPYLLGRVHPLRNAGVAGDARQLERAEGLPPIPVRQQDVHTFTTEPNAQAMGLGSSRRVVLWDTLLDGRFTRPQIRVVLAHEFGHLARNHIWKSLAWYALFAFPGTFLIAVAARRRGGMSTPEAVPLALLVLVVLQLLALPLENLITRHLEAEADWRALETTHDPRAAEGLFERLATTSLAEPSPPMWDYLLLENHPTIAQRIAMAQAWKAGR